MVLVALEAVSVVAAVDSVSVVVAVEAASCKHILSEKKMQVNTDRSMIDQLTHFLYVSAGPFSGPHWFALIVLSKNARDPRSN